MSGSSDVLVRVLYNGEDETGRLRFCRRSLRKVEGVRLCPLKALKSFLRSRLFANVGAEGLEDVCSVKSDAA